MKFILERFYAFIFGLMLIFFGLIAPRFTFKTLKEAIDKIETTEVTY